MPNADRPSSHFTPTGRPATTASARRRHWRFDDVRLEPAGDEAFFLLPDVDVGACELDVQFEPADGADLLGVVVRADAQLERWTEVVYDPTSEKLGQVPFKLEPGEGLRLRVFVDNGVVEASANGRACWTVAIDSPPADARRVGLLVKGGGLVVARSVDVWELRP